MAWILHQAKMELSRDVFLKFSCWGFDMLESAYQVQLNPEIPGMGMKQLAKTYCQCEARLGRPATNLEVCSELGMSLGELYSLLDSCRGVGLGRIDNRGSADIGDSAEPVLKYFPDPGSDEAFTMYSASGFQAAMTQAIEALPKNEKLVLSLCHEEDLPLGEVARIFGVSEARVAQLHTIAMLRIRGKLHYSAEFE